jgi:hypothetical protein
MTEFKTASLCLLSFTDVHEGTIFGLSEPFSVRGGSPTFTGVGVRIGVNPCFSLPEMVQLLRAHRV